MYLVVSAAGAKGLWHEVNRVKLVIAAAAGILVATGAVFGAIYKATSPLDTVAPALGIWLLLGVIWAFFALRRQGRPGIEFPVADPAPLTSEKG
jgi:hypothetical protein